MKNKFLNIFRGENGSFYTGVFFNTLPIYIKKYIYKKRFLNYLDKDILIKILSLNKLKNVLVFDCGGNVGLWTDIFMTFGYSIKVFEPGKDCILYLNKRFKGRSKVELFPIALSNFKGTQEFYIGTSNLSESGSLNIVKNNVSDINFSIVDVDKLSTYMKIYKPNFVKIDVEGSEIEILNDLLLNLTNEEILDSFFAIETHEKKIHDLDEKLQILKREINERGLSRSFNFNWR
jgi:FkbM family methyltransferase